jgi:SPP1 gp7 family putative phage head morphogenesis protein
VPSNPAIPPFNPTFQPASPEQVKKLLASKLLLPQEEIAAIAAELGDGVWDLAWSVATVTDYAVLQSLRESLLGIMDSGGTMRDWLDMLDEMGWRSPLGAGHEETIFRTTLGSVQEAERYDILMGSDAVEYLVFDAIDDDRVDEECLVLDGKAWPRDEFPPELWPPLHFNCRCSVIPADASDLDSLGAEIHDGPPPLDHVAEGFDTAPSVRGLTTAVQQSIAGRLQASGWVVNPRLAPPGRAA